MRARRYLLLAGIAGGALTGALCLGGGAWAASPDIGSWGQAWGDDGAADMPAPQPRARATVPSGAPVPAPAAATPATPMPKGPSAAEIGGWGDAWGDGAPPVAAPSRPPAAAPVATAATPLPGGPAPAEIRGWGDAWEGPAAPAPTRPASPARTAPAQAVPAAVAVPAAPAAEERPSPIRVQAPAAPAQAAGDEDSQPPVQLTADQITYDRELGIVSARGRVEIVQERRMLVADQVNYNLKQDIISASGNVRLAEPTGETLYTEYFELTGDMKEGVAKEIRSVLADRSRMTASGAQRVGGNRTDFDNGAYTACEPCRSNPSKRPLWEAKAARITHNEEEKTIEYRDAWMELAGVPFLYTPYLSHPDPTVKRKSGFLTPTAGMSSNIGTSLTVPYFWAVKDNQDFTFAPRFLAPSSTAKDSGELSDDNALKHLVLAGEHRWRGMDGEERTFASLTADKYTGDLRGHINSRARFDLSSDWRAGYQIERATDDTYTRIYSYRILNEQPWLTTRPYLEGFGRRSYTLAEGFAYQGMRSTDAITKSPLVLPHITTSQMSIPDAKGGYYTYDADMLSYSRVSGTDATRLSNTVGWHRPYMGSMGDVTTLSTSLRADAYHADDLAENEGSANTGRAIPTVAANWRMPFARPSSTMPQVIEPMVMVAASPNGGNSSKIPNEDSVGFELDELSVFRPNRLPGFDRVEGGVRGAYGLRWQAFPGQSSWITAAVAQGWRARDDSTFGAGSGFTDNFSDYLARLDLVPSRFFELRNRMRLDKDTGELKRNENTLSVGSPILRTSLSYVLYEATDDGENSFPRQHAATWELSSALTRYWTFRGGVSYDLNDGGGPRWWTAKLAYDDECFAFITDMRREYTYDRDYLSGYSLVFNVVFKTLGGLPVNVF